MRTVMHETRAGRAASAAKRAPSSRIPARPSRSLSPDDVLTLQRLAGNQAVATVLQREPAADAATGATGSALDQAAQDIKSDTDNALGQRIKLSPELISAAAGAPVAGSEQETDYDKQVKKRSAQSGSTFGRGEFGLYPSHVEQRYIGDCYLMAAMAAVARANPDAIRKLIKPAGPGKYEVSLYEHRWLVGDAVHKEIIDTTVPVGEDGKPLYGMGELTIKGDTEADRPLWPLLIEKAYAQWKGGYNKIGHGRYANQALEALTGHEASEKKTSDYTPVQIGKAIEQEIKDGKAIEASSGNMPPDVQPLGTKGNAGEHEGMVGTNKVVFHHAYAVENVETPVGTIDLQNPWGYEHIQDMALADFKRCFDSWDEERTK